MFEMKFCRLNSNVSWLDANDVMVVTSCMNVPSMSVASDGVSSQHSSDGRAVVVIVGELERLHARRGRDNRPLTTVRVRRVDDDIFGVLEARIAVGDIDDVRQRIVEDDFRIDHALERRVGSSTGEHFAGNSREALHHRRDQRDGVRSDIRNAGEAQRHRAAGQAGRSGMDRHRGMTQHHRKSAGRSSVRRSRSPTLPYQ